MADELPGTYVPREKDPLPELHYMPDLLQTRNTHARETSELDRLHRLSQDDKFILETKGACYVYLARHHTEPRFKIGLSIHPAQRLSVLKRRDRPWTGLSLQAQFPSDRRAREVESGMHRLLAPWRLKLNDPRDGYTEWFHADCWTQAATVLTMARAAAGPNRFDPLAFDADHPAVADLMPLLRMCNEAASHRPMTFLRDQRSRFQGFLVHGLRDDLKPPMHRLRYPLMAPQSYEVQLPGGQGPRTLLRGPITWDAKKPSHLRVEMLSADQWRRRGAYGRLVALWVGLVEQALIGGQIGWRIGAGLQEP